MTNGLTLKWGTLKYCDFRGNEKAIELLAEYNAIGSAPGCAQQHDTPIQKEIICELIDVCDDPEGIFLDWDGVYVSKDKAKEYVRNYGMDIPISPSRAKKEIIK